MLTKTEFSFRYKMTTTTENHSKTCFTILHVEAATSSRIIRSSSIHFAVSVAPFVAYTKPFTLKILLYTLLVFGRVANVHVAARQDIHWISHQLWLALLFHVPSKASSARAATTTAANNKQVARSENSRNTRTPHN